jgi:phosphoribosylformylglycinamidine (FGAM) synthase-like enzyme
VHDVGAGGLSNAIPELLHDSGVGGVIDLGKVPSDDPSLSPMQLWCNESQERYVLGIAQSRVAEFAALCARERCVFAVVGTATKEGTPGGRLRGRAAGDRPADGRAVRQGAEDAPRHRAPGAAAMARGRHRRARPARGRPARARAPERGREDPS